MCLEWKKEFNHVTIMVFLQIPNKWSKMGNSIKGGKIKSKNKHKKLASKWNQEIDIKWAFG